MTKIGDIRMKMTERETQIYQYIVDYMQEHMYAPTIREICKAVGLSSTASVAFLHGAPGRKGIDRDRTRCAQENTTGRVQYRA